MLPLQTEWHKQHPNAPLWGFARNLHFVAHEEITLLCEKDLSFRSQSIPFSYKGWYIDLIPRDHRMVVKNHYEKTSLHKIFVLQMSTWTMCVPKVHGPRAACFLNRVLIFDCYMVQWGSKNKHYKDTCWKEIGLHLQILTISLHSIVNTFRKTYLSN